MIERVILVSPRGFCAGVLRAIATVERALEIFGPPVYVRRAIVHNQHVADRLAAAGAVFVHDLDAVPRRGVAVFGAHGVAATIRRQASERDLRIVDATCPLVAKVHREVRRYRRLGYGVVLIGHRGHDEVVGTLGQAPGVQLVEDLRDVPRVRPERLDRVACVTQTTIRPQNVEPVIDALRKRFPALALPACADVCYATRSRQAAIEWLARQVDVVLVVGDVTSSNSRRLWEAAAATGCPAYLIPHAAALKESWLEGATTIGVSAGASTPDDLVIEVADRLCRDGAELREEAFMQERVAFRLPSMPDGLLLRGGGQGDSLQP
jgi:4-hydroxy-3-methylbut-2-enyl diphosphate reductase